MDTLFLYKHIKYLLKKTVKICRKNLCKTHCIYNCAVQFEALWHAEWHHTVSFLFLIEFLEQHTYSMNYRPRDCKQLIVLNSFFFLQNSATKVPRWQHQIEDCSMKFSLQPKHEFKSSTLEYIREYTGTSCTRVWAAQQVGRDRALLGLGLQSVKELVLSISHRITAIT
jgi:hypothetical protein